MYKTILVHVDNTPRAATRIDVAAQLARRFDAHLVGTAITGLPPYLYPANGFNPAFSAIPLIVEQLRAEADRALEQFESRAREAGIASLECRRSDDEPGWSVSMQARHADLLVLGQASDDDGAPVLRSDFPEYVLLNCARPVLIVPAAGFSGKIGQRVTVAWNGNAESVRAMTSALPLLQAAQSVDLVIFDAGDGVRQHGHEPGAEVAAYLARHAVRLQVSDRESRGDIGKALLAHAAAQHSDLIVMGAYGHSRLREILLGGVTRSALRNATLPLWMAH